jgi:hypothetical protein
MAGRRHPAASRRLADDRRRRLAIIDELSGDARLERYYLLEATRADLLRRRGDRPAAAAAYQCALPLAPSEAERRYLLDRLREVSPLPTRQTSYLDAAGDIGGQRRLAVGGQRRRVRR